MDARCIVARGDGDPVDGFFFPEMCDNVVVRRLMTRICRPAMPGRVHKF